MMWLAVGTLGNHGDYWFHTALSGLAGLVLGSFISTQAAKLDSGAPTAQLAPAEPSSRPLLHAEQGTAQYPCSIPLTAIHKRVCFHGPQQ